MRIVVASTEPRRRGRTSRGVSELAGQAAAAAEPAPGHGPGAAGGSVGLPVAALLAATPVGPGPPRSSGSVTSGAHMGAPPACEDVSGVSGRTIDGRSPAAN